MTENTPPADVRAQVRVRRALAERRAAIEAAEVALQALHDIRGLLGFDNDGELTPHAQIAGAGSAERYVELVLADVREYLADRQEAEAEDSARMTKLRKRLDEAALGHQVIHCKELFDILDGPV